MERAMDTLSRSGDRLHVVVAGGGVAALEAILALNALAEDSVTLELVAPGPDFTYRPLAVAEPFRVADVQRFPLAMFTQEAGADLRQATITAVDSVRHVVECDTGAKRSHTTCSCLRSERAPAQS
jgi:sulfide:quinone oxidoreductase